MRDGLLILHVAEECLAEIAETGRGNVKVAAIHRRLQRRLPSVVGTADYWRVRRAMKLLFPIYKNHRRRTKVFKLRIADALSELKHQRLRLRPINHLRMAED